MKQRQSARLVKASDVIVDGIRDRILHERLPVGSPLPSEADLMEDYGLGRVTVSCRFDEAPGAASSSAPRISSVSVRSSRSSWPSAT